MAATTFKDAQSEAERVKALAVDIGTVLNNPEVSFSHYHAYQGKDLNDALLGRGLTTVGNITGSEPARFHEKAEDRLSVVFGVPAQQIPAMTPREEFAEALKSIGCVVCHDHPIMDGKAHRITVEGEKFSKHSGAGFYVGHLDGQPWPRAAVRCLAVGGQARIKMRLPDRQ